MSKHDEDVERWIAEVREELARADSMRVAGGGNGRVPVQVPRNAPASDLNELRAALSADQWDRLDWYAPLPKSAIRP